MNNLLLQRNIVAKFIKCHNVLTMIDKLHIGIKKRKTEEVIKQSNNVLKHVKYVVALINKWKNIFTNGNNFPEGANKSNGKELLRVTVTKVFE